MATNLSPDPEGSKKPGSLPELHQEIERLRERLATVEAERDEFAQQNSELFVLQQVFSTINSTLEINDILSMVLRETLLLALIGVAAGLAAAGAMTRLASAMLYNLKPTDPLTFIAAAFLLTIIALASGFLPARRASGVDPMHALRHE